MEENSNEKTDLPNSKYSQTDRPGFDSKPELLTFAAATIDSLPSVPVRVAEKNNRYTKYGLGPYPTEGMAAYSANGSQRLMKFQRRALGAKDVAIELAYCGVCHSDIHTIREDWGKIQYPQIVGHELAGKVVAVGSAVSKFKVGSRVGVGCMVNSCGHCLECDSGFEQYCENGSVQTYASKDRDGTITQGGYSKFNVVNENFIINIPDSIDLAHAGPLMCAGITVFSPMRHWNIGLGKTIAVIGLGGLGHMATQIGAALGADVTVFTTSEDKIEDAKRFGAKRVVVNKDGQDFSMLKRSFDFILDTVPYQHDLERFIPLLKRDATICIVGVGRVTEPHQIGPMSLLGDRNSIAGSAIGGIRETQELIDFCAQHGIRPEITKIAMGEIDEAWKKVVAKKARYRFVMDMNA